MQRNEWTEKDWRMCFNCDSPEIYYRFPPCKISVCEECYKNLGWTSKEKNTYQVRECDDDDEQEFSIIENEDGEWRFTLEEAEAFFEATKEERCGAKLRLVKVPWCTDKYCDGDDEIEVVSKNY